MSEELTKQVDSNGTIRYYLHGVPHREGAPAVIFPDGGEIWFYHNTIHRDDGGPAVSYASGYKMWCRYGKRHRLDGPAVENSPIPTHQWWLDGKYYKTEKEWEKARCPSIETLKEMFKEVQHE